MSRLSNEKQEKYANYLANGYTQMAAYKEAGYTCKNSTAAANASRLAASETITNRIEELKLKSAEKEAKSTAPPLPLKKIKDYGEIDLDFINREYLSLLDKAKDLDDLKNAVIILDKMAELNKVRPEKTEETNNNRMLPSNDKSSSMGNQINISLINQESPQNGGSFAGPFAIEIPDSAPLRISNYEPDEDGGT